MVRREGGRGRIDDGPRTVQRGSERLGSTMKYDVFISHRSDDKPWVRTLATNLQKAGLSVFLDEWELVPGDSFIAGLEQGLENSAGGVLVCTPGALESGWVRAEYDRMIDSPGQPRRRLSAGADRARSRRAEIPLSEIRPPCRLQPAGPVSRIVCPAAVRLEGRAARAVALVRGRSGDRGLFPVRGAAGQRALAAGAGLGGSGVRGVVLAAGGGHARAAGPAWTAGRRP